MPHPAVVPRSLRDYQTRAVRRVREEWDAGHRSVCLVAPTGSGKTTMGAAIVATAQRSVWVAHRRELVSQAADRLRRDGLLVGVLCPGHDRDDAAPIQVGTIQTLLAGGHHPDADLVVLDEAHHYAPASEHWSTFAAAYQGSKVLGLTATPERRDGSPLGDVFDALVEAASYSELIAAGHLVDCHVFRGPDDEAVKGWALDPLTAYQRDGNGGQAFAFFDRVDRAEEWAANFCAAGIPATTISERTNAGNRAAALAAFAAGVLRIICNVYTMTEGIDFPAAAVCILARSCEHPSTYLQMCGRVLRPSPGKLNAILLDLMSMSSVHGYPTRDRVYSLDGEAIGIADKANSITCRECGHVYARGAARCPRCGYSPPKQPLPEITIYSSALRRVYAGADTPEPAKAAEWARLRQLARSRGFSLSWAAKEYEKAFLAAPSLHDVTPDEQRREYEQLLDFARSRGFKDGFAAHRYKALFGCWPPRSWSSRVA